MVIRFLFCFACLFLMFCAGCGEEEQARLQVGGDEVAMTETAGAAGLSFFEAYPENWEHARAEQTILAKYGK